MNDLQVAEAQLEEGCKKLEGALTAIQQNFIEAGIATVAIKESCDSNPNGTTNFPAVMVERFGLTKSASDELLHIGLNAERLSAVADRLPRGSRSTLNVIARMDDDTIADKIERHVIHPAATRAQVLEKKRVSKEVTVDADDTDSPDLSAVEVYATLPKKHQKALEAYINSEMAKFKKKTRKEVAVEADAVAKERAELRLARNNLNNEIKYAKRPFTREEYQLIRGMLHPDKHPGLEERAARAVSVFTKIEKLCKVSKNPLKSVKSA